MKKIYIILNVASLGGGSGRRVGLKIQSGSPLVPVQVRLKAFLHLFMRCFLLSALFICYIVSWIFLHLCPVVPSASPVVTSDIHLFELQTSFFTLRKIRRLKAFLHLFMRCFLLLTLKALFFV